MNKRQLSSLNHLNIKNSGGGDSTLPDFEALKAQIKSMPSINLRHPRRARPSRPNKAKIAAAAKLIAQVLPAERINSRSVSVDRINSLLEIAKLAGEKPENWKKPNYGDFEYWLGRKCGWISDEEYQNDTRNYEVKRKRALGTSHQFASNRYSWNSEPIYEVGETRDFVPQVSMRIVNDRNLTDSARRLALFIMRQAYQDSRAERCIGMTVSFVMGGLAISRRTVQRCLTLLEKLGYLQCEVATAGETKMCIGLVVRLLEPLFPKHHKKSWPANRINPGASRVSQKQSIYKNTSKEICNAPNRVLRLSWALKCMAGAARAAHREAQVTETSWPEIRPDTTQTSRSIEMGLAIPM